VPLKPPAGCLIVDQHQQTTVPGIYAIGRSFLIYIRLPWLPDMPAVAATHLHHTLPRNLKA
jgi:thioredoxin reductase (NADPH)